MELLDLYLHIEHRYNRFILYTLRPNIWHEGILGEEPEVRAALFKNNYEYRNENRYITVQFLTVVFSWNQDTSLLFSLFSLI